jgi:ABC-type amino acid transport substrate-binding protein
MVSFATLFLVAALAAGPEPPKVLHVDVATLSPMVMKIGIDGKAYSGYDIEILRAYADQHGYQLEIREVPFSRIFEGVRNGEADMATSGITITGGREKVVDFSHSYLNTGVGVMIRDEGDAAFDIRTAIMSIFNLKNAVLFGYFVAFLAVMSFVMWAVELGVEDGISDKFFPGIFQAFWFTIVTSATVGYGDITPRTWRGKAVGVLVMFSGIAFFGVIVAQLSSNFTVQQLNSSITSLGDLRGKNVATIDGSTSVELLVPYDVKLHTFKTVDEAYAKLIAGNVDAIVFDEPMLKYCSNTRPKGKVKMAPVKVAPQDYGVAFPSGSTLREEFNQTLLDLKETGGLAEINARYFGASE